MTILVQGNSYLTVQQSVQEYHYSHLTSLLLKNSSNFQVHLPWRTFTMSCPLQTSVRLLRRLRPPRDTLAFSCPTRQSRFAVWEFPSSNTRNVIATLSCLLYSERIETTLRGAITPQPFAIPFWSGCNNHFHPFGFTKLYTGFSRQHRSQDWSVNFRVVESSRTFLSGLQTWKIANPPRLPDSPCFVV